LQSLPSAGAVCDLWKGINLPDIPEGYGEVRRSFVELNASNTLEQPGLTFSVLPGN
jgi:hypothetical protein